jgi:hypothetical protein
MPDNELIIYFKMVDQASGTAARAGATMRQQISQTAKAQEQADQAYIRAIKLQERAYKDLAASKTKIDKERAAQQKRDEDAYIQAVKQNANAAAKIDRDQASNRERLNRQTNALLKQFAADETRAAKQADAEKTRSSQSAFRAWKQAHYEQHKLTMMNWAEEQAALKQNISLEDAATAAIKSYALGLVGVGAVAGGIKAVSDYLAQIRRDTIDSVKEMEHFREVVLQLAAMKGNLGQSTGELAAQMEFRAQTALTQQGAVALSQSAEGAGQAAIGANVTRQAFEEGKVIAGRLAVMENSDPGAIGDLYGTYNLEARKGASGADLGAAMARGYKIAQPGRFATTAEFAKQRSEISPYVQTGVVSGAQADALVSAMSLIDKGQAATLTRQALTAASADFMRNRNMKMLPGMEHESSAEYFQKTLKLNDQTTPMERLMAVADDLNKQEELTRKAGRTWNANDYLLKHSVMNQESRQAYMAMAGLRKSGQWQNTFEPLISQPGDVNDINTKYQQFLARDPVGKMRQAEMSHDAAAAMRSVSPEGRLEAYQREEFDKLFAQKKVVGKFEDWQTRSPLMAAADDLFYGGYHSQVNLGVQRRLTEEAAKLGMGADDINFAHDWNGRVQQGPYGPVPQMASEAELASFARKIELAGGNVLQDAATMMLKAAEMIRDTAAGKTVPPPAPLQVQPGPAVRPNRM